MIVGPNDIMRLKNTIVDVIGMGEEGKIMPE